jgi:hypothetical protein
MSITVFTFTELHSLLYLNQQMEVYRPFGKEKSASRFLFSEKHLRIRIINPSIRSIKSQMEWFLGLFSSSHPLHSVLFLLVEVLLPVLPIKPQLFGLQ